ncbi:hypothetical protein Mapa_018321 [Marchantia paleacea]|nr:hypothetical protein Mapa_018882 [Marchantia paleacea]KAG6540054.1 hypothetical protein Mapa_018637 [Marchantia paleacea]KAG6540417.1 hypothetical protein Mapa_018321 [Marchantia paleacea]
MTQLNQLLDILFLQLKIVFLYLTHLQLNHKLQIKIELFECHFWIPFPSLVTKMNTCFHHFF